MIKLNSDPVTFLNQIECNGKRRDGDDCALT